MNDEEIAGWIALGIIILICVAWSRKKSNSEAKRRAYIAEKARNCSAQEIADMENHGTTDEKQDALEIRRYLRDRAAEDRERYRSKEED